MSPPPNPPSCNGVWLDTEDEQVSGCWVLTDPGQSCVTFCGSLAATDWAATISKGSNERVVTSLTKRYLEGDFSYAVNVDQPCGKVSRDAPTGQYLYMKDAYGWDCYDKETFLLIDGTFQSPCKCGESPEIPVLEAITSGAYAGGAVLGIVAGAGALLDLFGPSVGWRSRVAAASLLGVADAVAFFFTVLSFLLEGLWLYFFASVAMVAVAGVTSLSFHMRPNPLGATIGDVVKSKAFSAYPYGVVVSLLEPAIAPNEEEEDDDPYGDGVSLIDDGSVVSAVASTFGDTEYAASVGRCSCESGCSSVTQVTRTPTGSPASRRLRSLTRRRSDIGPQSEHTSPRQNLRADSVIPADRATVDADSGSGVSESGIRRPRRSSSLSRVTSSLGRPRGARRQQSMSTVYSDIPEGSSLSKGESEPTHIEDDESSDDETVLKMKLSLVGGDGTDAVSLYKIETPHHVSLAWQPAALALANKERDKANAAFQESLLAQEQARGVEETELEISFDVVLKEWATWARTSWGKFTHYIIEKSPYLALLFGVSSLTEAAHILFFTGKETPAFGVLRLVHASIVSGPFFCLLLLIATGEGFYRLFRVQTFFDFGPTIAASQVDLRGLFLAIVFAALSLISAELNFVLSPMTDPPSRIASGYFGSATVALATSLFFASDLALRALAVICFGYALLEAGPSAFVLVFSIAFVSWAVSIRFLPSTRAALQAYGVRAWLSLGVKALIGLVSYRLLFAVSAVDRLIDVSVSTVVGVIMIWMGLAQGKDQLDDPELISGVITATVLVVICKLSSFFWCVYPAMTQKYDMVGVAQSGAASEVREKAML